MEKYIFCKIIDKHGTKNGMIFRDDNITRDKLINWVKRNCKGASSLKVTKEDKEPQVHAQFETRTEIYYIKGISY